MKHLSNFELFEKTKLQLSYDTKNQAADKKHNDLARKGKEDHKWTKKGDKKSGKSERVQNFECQCGKKKKITRDANDKLVVSFS